jgi:polyisoprenoid-binding protein YceI
MTSTLWTTIAAVSTIGLMSALAGTPSDEGHATRLSAGGPPDTLVAAPAASRIHWKATTTGGMTKHEGDVRLVRGILVVRHQKLTNGLFTIDLRGSNFADVEQYPTAIFTTTEATRTGDSTYLVKGNLTMHGVTQPLTYSTTVRWVEVGHMVATSTFSIDRRRWGLSYRGSRLGDELLGDDLQLSITLDARRPGAVIAER